MSCALRKHTGEPRQRVVFSEFTFFTVKYDTAEINFEKMSNNEVAHLVYLQVKKAANFNKLLQHNII